MLRNLFHGNPVRRKFFAARGKIVLVFVAKIRHFLAATKSANLSRKNENRFVPSAVKIFYASDYHETSS